MSEDLTGLTNVKAVTPDFSEPIIGWRRWMVKYDPDTSQPYLASLRQELRWPTQQAMVARCTLPDLGLGYVRGPRLSGPRLRSELPNSCCARSPRSGCSCGVYAVSDPTELQVDRPSRLVRYLSGRVALWGKVIRHERGYRAQYGYPLSVGLGASSLTVSSYSWEQIDRLANAYGCALLNAPPIQQAFNL